MKRGGAFISKAKNLTDTYCLTKFTINCQQVYMIFAIKITGYESDWEEIPLLKCN